MSLNSVEKYLKSANKSTRKLPPLEKWQPEKCGKIDLIIKANGEWWYAGKPMSRPALVNLFATVLWFEDDTFYLKTPIEQVDIEVEDVPFFINSVAIVEEADKFWIEFSTTTGDNIRLDNDHRLFFRQFNGEQRPYIPVRFGMYGLIMRNVFYHLIELGELVEQSNHTLLRLVSGGTNYELVFKENMS